MLDSEGEPVRVGPPSFDPETWQRIQSELAQRSQNPRQRRHSVNPLLGVVKCGVCGKNMRQQSKTTPAGVTHRYYICAGSPPCSKVSHIAADAEELVEHNGPRIPAPGGAGFAARFDALKPYFDEMFLGRSDVPASLADAERAANSAAER